MQKIFIKNLNISLTPPFTYFRMVQNIRFGIPNILRNFIILNMVVLCALITLRKTVINFLKL